MSSLAQRLTSIPKKKLLKDLKGSNGSLTVIGFMNSVSSQSRAGLNKKWFDQKLEWKKRMRVRWHDGRNDAV